MIKNVYILIVLSAAVNIIQAGQISFIREDIDFTLKENAFYIDGVYYFRNNSDKPVKRIMLYPYPEDSTYLEPDSIFAYCCEDSTNALVKTDDTGSYFSVEIPPKGVTKYNVGYKQPFLGNHVEYILLTTRNWKSSFEEVNYKLSVEQNIKVDSLSYTPDFVSETESFKTYFWKRKDFMPDRNFKVRISYDK